MKSRGGSGHYFLFRVHLGGRVLWWIGEIAADASATFLRVAFGIAPALKGITGAGKVVAVFA
jgi:hypothetical protein